jgi:hypothetical protein
MRICEEKYTKKIELTKEQGYWVYIIVSWEVKPYSSEDSYKGFRGLCHLQGRYKRN